MRSFLVAVAAATALVPSAAFAAPGDPAGVALDDAVASLTGLGYDISGTAGSTASGGQGMVVASGSVDPAAGAAVEFKGIEGGGPVDLWFTQTPDALYTKIDIPAIQTELGAAPTQWLRVDESKIADPSNLPFDLSGNSDALGISGILTSVADVTYPDPNDPSRITGTVDLTAATGVGAPDPGDVQKAGDAAKAVPFTATIDDQGRLTGLKIDADAIDGDLSEDIHLSDFGSPAAVTPPPASAVVDAPEAAYQFFNR